MPSKEKGICGFSWTFTAGKVTINHRCGEESGHRGPHVCADCGVTR